MLLKRIKMLKAEVDKIWSDEAREASARARAAGGNGELPKQRRRGGYTPAQSPVQAARRRQGLGALRGTSWTAEDVNVAFDELSLGIGYDSAKFKDTSFGDKIKYNIKGFKRTPNSRPQHLKGTVDQFAGWWVAHEGAYRKSPPRKDPIDAILAVQHNVWAAPLN